MLLDAIFLRLIVGELKARSANEITQRRGRVMVCVCVGGEVWVGGVSGLWVEGVRVERCGWTWVTVVEK